MYELWQQTYPNDDIPYSNLAYIAATLGDLQKALEEARQALKLDPNNLDSYLNLGNSYSAVNQVDEADATFRQAEDRKLQGEFLQASLYGLAFLEGDTGRMAQAAAAAMGKPGTEDVLLAMQADTAAWYGKLKEARQLTRRAMDAAEHNDAKETAATYQAAAALREVAMGNSGQAREDANQALALAPNRDVQAMAALALAQAGDSAGAEKLMVELDKSYPLDTMMQRYWLPTIRAAVALQRKDPRTAIELLQATTAVELGQPTQVTVWLLPAYRARAGVSHARRRQVRGGGVPEIY